MMIALTETYLMALQKPKSDTARREAAEHMAISALTFLAADPEHLSRFVALAGLDPGNLRAAAQEPGFFAALLDHVTSDTELGPLCAAALNTSLAELDQARQVLAGPTYWESP
jgi:hypothetical protein